MFFRPRYLRVRFSILKMSHLQVSVMEYIHSFIESDVPGTGDRKYPRVGSCHLFTHRLVRGLKSNSLLSAVTRAWRGLTHFTASADPIPSTWNVLNCLALHCKFQLRCHVFKKVFLSLKCYLLPRTVCVWSCSCLCFSFIAHTSGCGQSSTCVIIELLSPS